MGSSCFISSQWHPSIAVSYNAFNYKCAEVLHLNMNEPTNEDISPQVSCVHTAGWIDFIMAFLFPLIEMPSHINGRHAVIFCI